jgi:hypothetical protein
LCWVNVCVCVFVCVWCAYMAYGAIHDAIHALL